VYWEGIDPWEPQSFGFDYARPPVSGVNVVIENVATYGCSKFNYSPKQTLRLVDTFHRTVERHNDRMALALTAVDARRKRSRWRRVAIESRACRGTGGEAASPIEQPAPPVTVSVRYLDWPDASAIVRNWPTVPIRVAGLLTGRSRPILLKNSKSTST